MCLVGDWVGSLSRCVVDVCGAAFCMLERASLLVVVEGACMFVAHVECADAATCGQEATAGRCGVPSTREAALVSWVIDFGQ